MHIRVLSTFSLFSFKVYLQTCFLCASCSHFDKMRRLPQNLVHKAGLGIYFMHKPAIYEFFANREGLIDFDVRKCLNRKSALFLGKD